MSIQLSIRSFLSNHAYLCMSNNSLTRPQFRMENNGNSGMILRKSSEFFWKSGIQLSSFNILGVTGVIDCVESIFTIRKSIQTLPGLDFLKIFSLNFSQNFIAWEKLWPRQTTPIIFYISLYSSNIKGITRNSWYYKFYSIKTPFHHQQ